MALEPREPDATRAPSARPQPDVLGSGAACPPDGHQPPSVPSLIKQADESSPAVPAMDDADVIPIKSPPEGMTTEVYSLPVDHRNTHLYVKGWVMKDSTKAPIVIVHDLGENIGLFRRCAHLLCQRGYSVYGFDLRGHGRSGQILGHIPKFDALLSDLLQVTSWVRFANERRAPFVIGQGIGALITIYFQKVFASYIGNTVLVSPVMSDDNYPSRYKRFLIKLLAEINPTQRLPRSLTPKFLSRRTKVKKDETSRTILSNYRITANFAKELITAATGAESAFYCSQKSSLILYPLGTRLSNFEQFNRTLLGHPRNSLITCYPLEAKTTNLLSGKNKQLKDNIERIVKWLEDHPHERYLDDGTIEPIDSLEQSIAVKAAVQKEECTPPPIQDQSA